MTERALEPTASPSVHRFQTDLLTLLREGILSGDDLYEDYLEIYSSISPELAKLDGDSDVPGEIYRRFIREWFRRMKISQSEWTNTLLPRALFSLEWNYSKIGEILGISPSRVLLLGFRSLEERLGPFGRHLSKDCARNDLFLVDRLLKRSWSDPLKIYRPEEFESHLKKCGRCADIYKSSEQFVEEIKQERLRSVPPELEILLRSESPGVGRGVFSWYHRLTWFNKIAFQSGGTALIVSLVLLVPYYQRIDIGRLFRSSTKTLLTIGETQELPDTDEPIVVDPVDSATSDPDMQTEVAELPEVESSVSGNPKSATETKAVEVAKIPTESQKAKPAPEIKTPSKVAVETKVATGAGAGEVQVAKNSNQSAASSDPPAEVKEANATAPRKYFYRWGARTNDPEIVATSVKRILEKYRVKRAGELDLGAAYKGGRYFHFTVSQSEYESLISEIRGVHFEDFTSTRTDSDRATMAGLVRIVFWVGPTEL